MAEIYGQPISFNVATSSTLKETSTMLAANWVNNTYSFETQYPSTLYNISIEIAPTATSEQYSAWGKIGLAGSATTNVATALKTVPTIDIPIIITVEVK